MDAAGLAQMNTNNFNNQSNGLATPASGLASRRGGQNLKPLSLASPPAGQQDNGVPTPRTSRSHLLAGLRTAPKSATASTFANSSSMASPTAQTFSNRNSIAGSIYSQGSNAYTAPKTALPQYGQQQAYNQMMNINQQQQQFTTEQVLAPPEIHVDDQDQMDPQLYAQLVATNMYLAQQQRALQQELLNIQVAAQQFQGLNMGGAQQQMQMQMQQQQMAMYQHQQRVQSMQQSMLGAMGNQQQMQQQQQQQVYAYVDPMTGQTKYYVDPNAGQSNMAAFIDQSQFAQGYGSHQQTPQNNTPRVQSAEEVHTPITDNESDSGRSGSGSLSGDMECSLPSSRTSTNGSWGAIGSDRPGSRQKTRKSLDSVSSATSGCESERDNSFASVFKNAGQKTEVEMAESQRKAPMLVLTSAEKRKSGPLAMP
ncbi:hypothetical protein BN1708_008014 [Verticillium longisporum]|uniref:Uncharacterized protein n=1 Tax=Verticillium longisporum TaxID=100787 RepID=A0A0G4N011_VERLO|nr:hypothetical protein BN1708_008014 [Verticillium longisporum]